jgi:hypothetical protein
VFAAVLGLNIASLNTPPIHFPTNIGHLPHAERPKTESTKKERQWQPWSERLQQKVAILDCTSVVKHVFLTEAISLRQFLTEAVSHRH